MRMKGCSVMCHARAISRLLLALALCCCGVALWAGGGPQNILVVMNARSKESLEIGNAYRRARKIPYRQAIALNMPTSIAISFADYVDDIEQPVRDYLRNQQLEDEVTSIVLTRGVPQLVNVENGRSTAGLLAGMNYPRPGGSVTSIANPYLEAPIAFSRRNKALRGMNMVTVLHGFHTRDIDALIARGIEADGAMPEGRFIFHASPQIARDVQLQAVDLLKTRGYAAEQVDALPDDMKNLLGYNSGGIYSGLTREMIANCTFLPGALADLAQNYGLAANNFDETTPPVLLSALWLVQAGATGVLGVTGEAGTRTMPAAGYEKALFDRYTSGFSLAESCYAAIPRLNWQNIVIGDPLCAPYARRPAVTLEIGDDPQHGTVPIRASATSPAQGTTISRMDLYIDDRFTEMIYKPANCDITLRVGGYAVKYTLPTDPTLSAMLDGMAEAINTHPDLSGPNGIKAVPQLRTGVLQLIARTPGEAGNAIPVSITVGNERGGVPGVVARAERNTLAGGGTDPTPARATLSFLGRVLKPGDAVTVQVRQEKFTCTLPEGKSTMAGLLDQLVEAVTASQVLQQPDGVTAYRDAQGMPVIVLEARTPGDQGNQIPFKLAVKPVEGSQLRGYPDAPTFLSGGHDGSAASADLHFLLGETTAKGSYPLDTTTLADGYHRLRVVAYDGSPAKVQGYKDAVIQVKNLDAPPTVILPEKLGPASSEVTVPVIATEAVKRVDLYVDGQLLGSTPDAPFTITLPLGTLGSGLHDLWAEGFDADGNSYLTSPVPLEVITAPVITRVTPNYTVLAGGTTHRIIGSGFLPDCTVRLAGTPARSVKYLNPNLLEVVADAGPARLGWVEVTNPNGMVGTLALANAFEYYVPHVANIDIQPERDVLAPGQTARFTARCTDQFEHPIQAELSWSATAGTVTNAGVFTAPTTVGACRIYVRQAASKEPTWEAVVQVGPAAMTDGWLRQWLVLGSFPDPDYSALEAPLIPETAILPSHGLQTGERTWFAATADKEYMNFLPYFDVKRDTLAYAHVYLKAPAPTPCALVFGSDDGIRIWLNGQQIHSLRQRRPADPNQTTLPITLQAGWNRLLVKVDQWYGAWGFYMRLQPLPGNKLPPLFYQLDNPQEQEM